MLEEAAKTPASKLNGARVVVQGYGNVGSWAGAAGRRARLQADRRLGRRGRDPQRRRHRPRPPAPAGLRGARRAGVRGRASRSRPDELLATECDVFIPAALGGMIHEANADQRQLQADRRGRQQPDHARGRRDPRRQGRLRRPRRDGERRRRRGLLLRVGPEPPALPLDRGRGQRAARRHHARRRTRRSPSARRRTTCRCAWRRTRSGSSGCSRPRAYAATSPTSAFPRAASAKVDKQRGRGPPHDPAGFVFAASCRSFDGTLHGRRRTLGAAGLNAATRAFSRGRMSTRVKVPQTGYEIAARVSRRNRSRAAASARTRAGRAQACPGGSPASPRARPRRPRSRGSSSRLSASKPCVGVSLSRRWRAGGSSAAGAGREPAAGSAPAAGAPRPAARASGSRLRRGSTGAGGGALGRRVERAPPGSSSSQPAGSATGSGAAAGAASAASAAAGSAASQRRPMKSRRAGPSASVSWRRSSSSCGAVLALQLEVLADRVVEQAHRGGSLARAGAGLRRGPRARSTRFLPARLAR